jgi:hypothetical protein
VSSVRMCDKCGNIFSENEEDWSTYSGTMKRRREDGSRYTESVTQDACPPCTNGPEVVKPRLAVTAAPFPETAEHRADPVKIRTLEHELGMDDD